MTTINMPEVLFEGINLRGKKIEKTTRTISNLKDVFADNEAYALLNPNEEIYNVECYFPVKDGVEGGLFFGITHLNPGTVGNEYFLTKGHFHQVENRGEFYWGIEGSGMLILMDKDRNTWAEKMYPGSLHYVPGCTGHRVANTGDEILSFGACWPSDAGHNYEIIMKDGFSKRLLKINGAPQLV